MSDQSLENFEFKGTAKEWFGIWIVNLLLSIITIGIYSAWAKVRREKYFKNSTYVSGRNFDYHATGKQIFIGRLIIIGGYILFNIVLILAPLLGVIMMVALLFAMPWLIVRSITFNARMTSFSNVRFDFVGGVGEAFLVFFLYPILTALTAYTTLPFASRAANSYLANNYRLGLAKFSFKSGIGKFYKAFLCAAAWVVIAVLFIAAAFGTSFMALTELGTDSLASEVAMMSFLAQIYIVMFVGFIPAALIYGVMVRNVILNEMTLEDGHRFRSTLSVIKILWIALSNLVVIVLTLGLMIPWAQVRMAKYAADNTAVIPAGSLDQFVGLQQEQTSAIGDAFTDFEGIDVNLPL